MSRQDLYGSISPGRGKWSKCDISYIFLELCCEQTVWCFQLFSTVLKTFCQLHSKNVFVLVLAHLETELELFECFFYFKTRNIFQSAVVTKLNHTPATISLSRPFPSFGPKLATHVRETLLHACFLGGQSVVWKIWFAYSTYYDTLLKLQS